MTGGPTDGPTDEDDHWNDTKSIPQSSPAIFIDFGTSVTDRRIDGGTDGQTDGPTDEQSLL